MYGAVVQKKDKNKVTVRRNRKEAMIWVHGHIKQTVKKAISWQNAFIKDNKNNKQQINIKNDT